MLRKAVRIVRASLPRIDDFIRSALTAIVAAGLYVLAGLVPEALAKPAGLVAHTFAVVAVISLINGTYSRLIRHGVHFVKHRLGLGHPAKEDPSP